MDDRNKGLYYWDGEKVTLNLHPGQTRAWESLKRFVFVIAGTQGGKTSFGPFWLRREILLRGPGDYLAVTSNYDLFKLKLLPEIRYIFEDVLGIARYWASERILEIRDPETQEFLAKRADDPMYARVILRSAVAKGGLESSSAKGAWLDECGQPEFTLDTWEAVRRRLSLAQGRVLGTTTPYNLGWLKQNLVDAWEAGDPEIDVIRFASIQNPAFPKDEYNAVKLKMATWKFNMMYRGIFTRPAGMIYEDFQDTYRENGGHKVKPFEMPKHWPRYIGVDPGAVHTAKVWVAHDTDNDVFYAYHETMEGNKTTAEHVEEVRAFNKARGEKLTKWFVGNLGEKQVRLDYEKEGAYPVKAPPFADVEAGIDRVTELIKTKRVYIFDTCKRLLSDLMSYSRELDSQGEPTEVIKDKNLFHFADAFRYFAVGVMPKGKTRNHVQRVGVTGLYGRDRNK